LTSVRVTPKADDDILSIASFIAQDYSVPRAQVIDNLREARDLSEARAATA
jgi:plasmid stabilization system protein ParE